MRAMRAYADFNGKFKWSNTWGDKTPKTIKKVFKKSARRAGKGLVKKFQFNS